MLAEIIDQVMGWESKQTAEPKMPPVKSLPKRGVSSTSVVAYERTKQNHEYLRQKALLLIFDSPDGCTADDVAADFELTRKRGQIGHNASSPRITELAQMGYIKKTGERRKTRSGMMADVWECTKAGMDYIMPVVEARMEAQRAMWNLEHQKEMSANDQA